MMKQNKNDKKTLFLFFSPFLLNNLPHVTRHLPHAAFRIAQAPQPARARSCCPHLPASWRPRSPTPRRLTHASPAASVAPRACAASPEVQWLCPFPPTASLRPRRKQSPSGLARASVVPLPLPAARSPLAHASATAPARPGLRRLVPARSCTLRPWHLSVPRREPDCGTPGASLTSDPASAIEMSNSPAVAGTKLNMGGARSKPRRP